MCHEYPDLASRAVFPPLIPEKLNDKEPPGHKKPLGSQSPPQGPVKEYIEFLDAQTFWETHVNPHIPLVYRGLIKDSPAIKLWNDEYLTKIFGDLDVLVEHKKEDRTSTSGRMKLADFIKHYKTDDLYVVSMFPTEMMHEVEAVKSILCGTFKNFTHESNLWISAGGTRSVVHYDADHNFHCVIDGRKDFIMIPNNLATKTNLYFKQKDPSVGSGFSFLDPDSIDMLKFPRIAKVPWTWAKLYPGDCIFIPSVYIHQVRGYGRTLAVTTLFTADVAENFNSDDCTDDILKKDATMADISFLWTYKKGDPTIDMGYMNTEIVKTSLLQVIKEERNLKGKMTMQQFISYSGTFSPYGRNRTKIADIWKNVFGFDKNTILDREKIRNLSLDQLRKYCRAIEAPHGVVTDGSEPVFVRPGERHKWESKNSDIDEEESRGDFLEDDESHIHQIVNHDNMLQYLSPEEREEYLRERQAEKEKFGLNYDAKYVNLEELSEEERIIYELSWRLEDVPKKFQKSIVKGKIPAAFKEEFMEALPDSIKERYGDSFQQNRVPKVMIKAMTFNIESDSDKRVEEEFEEEETSPEDIDGDQNIEKDEL